MREPSPSPSALGGLRVAELGAGVGPAFAGRWLAAFGATVTTVELPEGRWMRRYSPTGAAVAGETGPLAAYLDAGKQFATFDLESPEDRRELRDLVAGCDLVIHDLDGARLAQIGLSLDMIRQKAQHLIEVALLPFGSDGPYAGFAATAIVLLALGGFQYLTGEPDREPLMLPGFQPEYLTAFYGIIAGLAGVLARLDSRPGRRFEVSSVESLASLHQFTTSQWLYEGTIRSRHGNRWENLYPITMLPCRDGYLTLSMPGPEMWERLCLMIERPELPADPRFATALDRRRNADALDAILVEWLATRDMEEVFTTAQEQWRLPVNPYLELDGVLRDPQYSARGFWVEAGDDSPILHPGMPVRMSETPWRPALTPNPSPAAAGEGGQERTRLSTSVRHTAARRQTAESSSNEAPPLPFHRERGPGGEGHLPLTGLRVLDFTRVWSGPLCTRILADLGAEVIKIEPPFPRNVPSALGTEPGARPIAGPGKLSRNKLSVGIDLHKAAGRDLLKRLVARSDVLVENFSARVMPNFGLGYESLRAVNPGLIYLAMTGYGVAGPYREYLAYGSATEAMTGLTALLGYPREEPLNSAIAYPDPAGGLAGACSVLTALVYRSRTGRGQFLDLSQLEPATMLLGEYFLAAQMEGRAPGRTGNRHPEWAPHGTYRCRGDDQWISIAVRSDAEWVAFCRATGLSDLERDARFGTVEGRRAHRHELDAVIAAWTCDRDKFAVMHDLQRAGAPAGAVLNARELVENPHLAARRFMVDARAPEGGRFPMPGTPIMVDGRKREDWQAAPIRGEHNETVLRSILAMTDTEIEALRNVGALVDGRSAAG